MKDLMRAHAERTAALAASATSAIYPLLNWKLRMLSATVFFADLSHAALSMLVWGVGFGLAGLWLVVFPQTFISLFGLPVAAAYVFGGLLILLGVCYAGS